MRSYEGTVSILVQGCEPLTAAVVIDDITSPSWVGIVRRQEGTHEASPSGLAQVVLRSSPYRGQAAQASVMVSVGGLPTLRGRSRFALPLGTTAAGT